MGEYEFALEVLEEYRGDFESSDEVDGVAVVEQRLYEATGGAASTGPSRGEESTGRTGNRSDVLGWMLVAGGGAAAIGGAFPIAIAESRAQRLRCSPAAEGPSADGCGGVDEYRGLSSSEFGQKSRSVTTLRVLGIGLAAVGTGAAGWGIYRLASGSSRSAARADGVGALRVRPTVWTAGATLQIQFDF